MKDIFDEAGNFKLAELAEELGLDPSEIPLGHFELAGKDEQGHFHYRLTAKGRAALISAGFATEEEE